MRAFSSIESVRESDRNFGVLCVLALAATILISSDATAAYSGTTIRTVAVAGSFVPNDYPSSGGSYWFRETNARMSLVAGIGSCGTWRYGGVAMPIERITSSTTVWPGARIFGGDGACNRPQACVIATVYSSTGNISGQTAWFCTSGTTMTAQTMSMGTLTLPFQGGMVFDIAGMADGGLAPDTVAADLVNAMWQANGS